MSTTMLPTLMAVADKAELDVLATEDAKSEAEHEWDSMDASDPDLCLYRDRTVAILKRYARMSIEVGRLPSVLGRELFRGHVTGYQVGTFEDVVIFVHDVERCVAKLDAFSQQVVGKCIVLDYSQVEVARMMHVGLRTIQRELPDALDQLTLLFLRTGIMRERSSRPRARRKACQGGENGDAHVSDCVDGKNKF